MELKTLAELSIGERFYFADDRFKKVWQLDWVEEIDSINMFGRPYIKIVYHLINDNNIKKEEKLNKAVRFLR